MEESTKISIVIPAWNEEETIGDVIQDVKPFTDDLVVVDGHSTDRTREIAEELGARVVLDNNRGKGDAVRIAFHEVKHPITVLIDADYSQDPKDIPRIIKPILENKADLVLGSRMLGGSEELFGTVSEVVRLMGSLVISLTINYRYGVRLTDYQNGFRAIRSEVGRNIRCISNRTTIEQEMAMKCLKYGYRVTEIPAHEFRRRGGVTKIHVWKVVHYYLWDLFRGVFTRRKPQPPTVKRSPKSDN